MLIGITGKARTGKDTVANWFVENQGFVRHAFGDAVKQTAAVMFNIPLNYFYDDDKKEVPHVLWGISPREMAQKVGTECGRQIFFENIWVTRMAPDVIRDLNSDACAGVVISDVRFENEAEWIRNRGGIIFHMRRDSADAVRPHESEDGIVFKPGDWSLKNTGTLEDLYTTLRLFSDGELK